MKYKPNRPNRSDEDEDDFELREAHLAYNVTTHTQVKQTFTVPIDGPVREPAYYRVVCAAINEAEMQDEVVFEINSPGGYLSGLNSLLTSILRTRATTTAFINGECHSAASILALNCNEVFVSPYASMLVHFVSYGAVGKATDVKSKVLHTHAASEQLFRDTYRFFLSEKEMQECIGGCELWLSAEDIIERLAQRDELLEAEQTALEAESDLETSESLEEDAATQVST